MTCRQSGGMFTGTVRGETHGSDEKEEKVRRRAAGFLIFFRFIEKRPEAAKGRGEKQDIFVTIQGIKRKEKIIRM